MTLVCAWCDSFLGETVPVGRPGVSHGMCPKCLDERLASLSVEAHVPVPPAPSALVMPASAA
jgi:hypothetical protein